MNINLTTCVPKPADTMNDRERSWAITLAIKDADMRMRERYPLLRHQSAIGLICFLFCTSTIVVNSLLFIQGVNPWWLCLVVNALCMSVLREIEHDLIHNLYFRSHAWMQNLLMAAVWPFLGNLPHPWYRRRMHLLHHQTSGTAEDFEERLIGNGMKFGPLKILAMLEPGLASLFRKKEFAAIPFYNGSEFFQALAPVALFYVVASYGWLAGNVAVGLSCLSGFEVPSWLPAVTAILNTIAVVFVLPNYVRQVSVQILSSYMHYYGDVANQLQETQVMNSWWCLPLNLFCCNFGSTHSIHHFVVSQPFYLRQMVARQAHAAFRTFGVRFNDAASILRGNRFER